MRALVILLLMTSAVAAQSASDMSMLSKALAILQQQREDANNATVNSEARARVLADENAALQAKIKSLQDELDKAKAKSSDEEKPQ